MASVQQLGRKPFRGQNKTLEALTSLAFWQLDLGQPGGPPYLYSAGAYARNQNRSNIWKVARKRINCYTSLNFYIYVRLPYIASILFTRVRTLELRGSENSPLIRTLIIIHRLHIFPNAPYLTPKILHKHCFQFFVGRLWYPGEMKSKGYVKFWGTNNVHYGRCASGEWKVCFAPGKRKPLHFL